MLPDIVSSARAWLPLLIHPMRSLNRFVACWSTYDAAAWEGPTRLMESGVRLCREVLIPAFLLILIGSVLPSTPPPPRTSAVEEPSGSARSLLVDASWAAALSPYVPHAAELALPPPTTTTHPRLLSRSLDLPYLLRLAAALVASPAAADATFRRFAPALTLAHARLRIVLRSRKDPDPEARTVLSEGVRSGRVVRRRAYDLYLPPRSEERADEPADADAADDARPCVRSLLFFPGFGIHRGAYACVASKLSDRGVPVAVVALEPLRLAHEALGGGVDDVRRLIASAGRDVLERRRGSDDPRTTARVVEWALGGHSMGGYNALRLAEAAGEKPLSVALSDGSTSRIGGGAAGDAANPMRIVAWAAGNIDASVPNLRPLDSVRVFVLLASNDGIAGFTREEKRRLLSKLPRGSRLRTIEGGNHSGFASYDAASKEGGVLSINGRRDIPLEIQHEEAARQTAQFLLGG
ncbi:hypothetical protein ACHAWF_008428 [Thalassiosira exigua]